MRSAAALLLTIATLAGCSAQRPPASELDAQVLLTERGVENRTLAEAADLVEAGEPRDAFDLLVRWFRVPQTARHPARPEALLIASEALLDAGRTVKAFYYLDELLDVHADSDLYRDAARRQYEIADAVLRQPRRAFDLSTGPSDFDALEMLFRVQQRAPGSDLAEAALLRSANYYFRRGDYDFAEDAYTVFLAGFPRSNRAPIARLRQAWSNLLQYEGPTYDPTPLLDARAQLEDLQADGIGGEAVAGAIAYVDEQLADKSVRQADYYARVSRPRATRHLLAEAAQLPDTEAGRAAQRRLDRLPALQDDEVAVPEADPDAPIQDRGDPAEALY